MNESKGRITYQDLSKFKVPPGFRGRSAIWVQLWWLVQATVFAWSPQILYRFRVWLLRLFGARIGTNVLIRSSARVTYPWKLTIGDYVWIGDDSIIYNLAEVRIESNVAIAHRVYLCTGLHDISKVTFDIGAKPIVLEEEVWLPNDVYVGPGVRIGKGTVVAARSSVFGDLPGGIVAAGMPAQKIRDRVPGRLPTTDV
jgi:putative colanic acid biosynthesis acetyltransferase WcaF